MSRKDAIQEIKKMQAEANGKVFIGFVHGIYGPLRGLNFIIDGITPERIMDLIDEASEPNSMEVVTFKMEQAKKGLPPKDIKDLITQIWLQSQLATLPMILPFEMVKEAETKPIEVTTINQGMIAVHKKLKENKAQAEKDFYYYRLGKIW